MAGNIKINIDTSLYRMPTQNDIAEAKDYILKREENARILESKIDDLLADAAERITVICYKYQFNEKRFTIARGFNEQMMDEIAEVMDKLEADIMSLVYDYSLSVTDDEKHRNALAAWIALLGRGNRNFQDTLDGYLYKFMKDMEAAIAALRYANISMADAITKLKSNLHSIYTLPEVIAAFKESGKFNATFIRSKGIQPGGVGLSNNGSTNVTNMAKITLQMAWMREQGMEFEEKGAVGYWQGRGSLYNCDVCDEETGFHPDIAEIYEKSYPHPHCQCWRVPVFTKDVSL